MDVLVKRIFVVVDLLRLAPCKLSMSTLAAAAHERSQLKSISNDYDYPAVCIIILC